MSQMKFIILGVFMAIYLAVDVHSAPFHYNISNDELTVKGTVVVNLDIPIEELWDSLSKRHRYPIIYSGDTIALRSAHTHGFHLKSWFYCYSSLCSWSACEGALITSSGWNTCSKKKMFTITAKGKKDGEPIDSGDTVSLSSHYHGSSYRLSCSSSSSSFCRARFVTSSMKGGAWLTYSYATFEIYAKNADDGTPVQYGDVVGLKHPYSSNSAWLTYDPYGAFYPRTCSSSSKTSCAKENTNTGFKIFKKLS